MNKAILIGRLCNDPELRTTQSGVYCCKFTIAVDRRFADKNTGERQADFITCIAWRQTAEFVSRYFNKGKMIIVEGTLRNNNYQDKNHPDVTHYTMDVLVDNVEFAGDKGGQTSSPAPAQQTAPQQTESNTDGMDYGSLSDFEEILSDGTVPF
jgi:single-strand DNA-binding protein